MTVSILRLPIVMERLGRSRSSIYRDVSRGLLPKPIKLGERASAWPSHEIDMIIGARIAGEDEDKIRKLVKAIEAARSQFKIP